MNSDGQPHNLVASEFHQTGLTEPRPLYPGQLALGAEVLRQSDLEIARSHIEDFMNELYGTDRYPKHNARILSYIDEIDETAAVSREALEMTIIFHDFVEHTILEPEETVRKLGWEPDRASELKQRALATYSEIHDVVTDKDMLEKGFTFAIDASKWESVLAQGWRDGASKWISEKINSGQLSVESGSIMAAAAANNKDVLQHLDKAELQQTLKKHYQVDLNLGAISYGATNYNLIALPAKGYELLDLLRHPPANNPASTWRDVVEVLDFFAPALAVLGYKKLASELRGEALKFPHDDPESNAQRQHELSAHYFDEIKSTVTKLDREHYSDIEVDVEARVKSEGSIREKLSRKAYEGLHKVPDGVGLVFIVPDEMAGDEMALFAKSFAKKLTSGQRRIEAKHPAGNGEFENLQGDERASGYKAINMTFFYYPDDGSGAEVPFEIQMVTRTQDKMHLWGQASHLFRKACRDYTPEDQPYLDQLARRGQATREIAPGSTIYSIAEMMTTSPEIPSVFNELFKTIDTLNGARIVVPADLEATAKQLIAGTKPFGEVGELTVLPAGKVTEEQFNKALSLFYPGLVQDLNIMYALKLVKDSQTNITRDDSETSVLEGHVLPTALAAVMLAIQSDKQWDSKYQDPNEFISNVATIALLHDYVEDSVEYTLGDSSDNDAKQKTREKLLIDISHTFGSIIKDGVAAMTIPFKIEDEYTRREAYRQQIKRNEYARVIKPPDRWQNHITDLIKLTSMKRQTQSEEYEKIMDYFRKTDRHLSEDFTSVDLPDVYPRVHDIIWRLARQSGYKPADISLF